MCKKSKEEGEKNHMFINSMLTHANIFLNVAYFDKIKQFWTAVYVTIEKYTMNSQTKD